MVIALKFKLLFKILRGMKIQIVVFLLIIANAVCAQTPTQTIRGRVVDALNKKPLNEASIQISNLDIKTTSNSEGVFKLENVPVGRHIMSVSFVGYESLLLMNVYVVSGKETVLDISLNNTNIDLGTVTVLDTKTEPSITPSIKILEKDRFQYAATFADPARYASYAPGVAIENDQANNISIRGITPNAMQWYLEGAEIVNPNHLSNAGILSDRAAANGGGTMILSANLLEKTTLFQGVAPPQYGNALAGSLDMNIRKGNNQKRQTTLSAGVIGFDFATEGYFSKESGASYLINYRYSFTGLLNKLGVELGDEAIGYQDLSVHLNFPTKRMGDFSLFAVGGSSENVFEHKSMRSEWTTDKDSQDIKFEGRMGIAGVKHQIGFGKSNWQTVFVVSALDNTRNATGFGLNNIPLSTTRFENTHAKYFFKTDVKRRLGQSKELNVGVIVKNEAASSFDTYKQGVNELIEGGKGSGNWYIPFAELSGRAGEEWQYQIGARGVYFDFLNKFSFEPQGSLRFNVRRNQYLQLSYSRQSQLISPENYFYQINNFYIYQKKDFVKSHNLNLAYDRKILKDITFRAEGFAQFYDNVYENSIATPNSSMTILESSNPQSLGAASGSVRTVGGSVSLSQSFKKGYFWLANATIFDTKRIKDGFERDMLFNNQYVANALVGKEWALGKNQNRFVGASVRGILRGGFYDFYLNENVFQNPKRVEDYVRVDLNIYLKSNKKKWSSTVQLDIQNVMSKENAWATAFDRFQNKTLLKRQLGLIPNVSYKVEF
jgi:CarboxypepD_reg-like domain/TonB-dependent Receptor Plug Domain